MSDADSLFLDLERVERVALTTQPILDPAHVINVDVIPLDLSSEETPVELVPNSVKVRTVLCGGTDILVVLPLGRFLWRPEVGSSSDSESLSSVELDQNLVYRYATTTRRLHTVSVIEICKNQVKKLSQRRMCPLCKNPTLICMLKPMSRNEGPRMTITAYTIPAKELQAFAANMYESNLRRDRRIRSFQRKLNETKVKTVSATSSPGPWKRIRHLVSGVEAEKKITD